MPERWPPEPFLQRGPGHLWPMAVVKKVVTPLIKVTADNKGSAIPVFAECFVGIDFQTPGRIAYQYLVIADALDQHKMTETQLAQSLGISRKSLWERRQKLGIPKK